MRYIVILVFSAFYSLNCYSQLNESDLYEKAYIYLNDSILKFNYSPSSEFAQFCNECCVTGITLKFEPELQVAKRFIKNNHGFPYTDFAIKKYNFSDDCLKSWRLGIRNCELGNQVLDSLNNFWSDYEMKSSEEISFALKNFLSEIKDGYQVFFSDIYQNTLAAELKGFCLPYDEVNWTGPSMSFFIVFDEKGEIDQVYSGITIHYD